MSPRPTSASRTCVQVLDAARAAGIRIFYALHRRYRPGDYETWKYVAPIQRAAWSRRTFEYGTWGGELHPGSSLNRATSSPKSIGVPVVSRTPTWILLLKRHGIHRLIVMGLIAHTCLEATVRYGAELGYEVTVVKDATASYSDREMHAALEVNIPNYASAISPRMKSSTR